MTDETRRWFIEKVAQNPDYLERVYLPELEKIILKADSALREAMRKSGIEEIKYRMGWLDGAQKCSAILDGLRLSEGKKPAEPGLMARIFTAGQDRSFGPVDHG